MKNNSINYTNQSLSRSTYLSIKTFLRIIEPTVVSQLYISRWLVHQNSLLIEKGKKKNNETEKRKEKEKKNSPSVAHLAPKEKNIDSILRATDRKKNSRIDFSFDLREKKFPTVTHLAKEEKKLKNNSISHSKTRLY